MSVSRSSSDASAEVSKSSKIFPFFTLSFSSGGSRQEFADRLQVRDSSKCMLIGEGKWKEITERMIPKKEEKKKKLASFQLGLRQLVLERGFENLEGFTILNLIC